MIKTSSSHDAGTCRWPWLYLAAMSFLFCPALYVTISSHSSRPSVLDAVAARAGATTRNIISDPTGAFPQVQVILHEDLRLELQESRLGKRAGTQSIGRSVKMDNHNTGTPQLSTKTQTAQYRAGTPSPRPDLSHLGNGERVASRKTATRGKKDPLAGIASNPQSQPTTIANSTGSADSNAHLFQEPRTSPITVICGALGGLAFCFFCLLGVSKIAGPRYMRRLGLTKSVTVAGKAIGQPKLQTLTVDWDTREPQDTVRPSLASPKRSFWHPQRLKPGKGRVETSILAQHITSPIECVLPQRVAAQSQFNNMWIQPLYSAATTPPMPSMPDESTYSGCDMYSHTFSTFRQ